MPRNIDMDLLRSFVAIVESGSFTAAARTVDRTQSAISLQMKRLEEMLGVRLFERRGRGVSVTAAGRQLLADALAILDLNDRLLARMGAPAVSGEVRVDTTEDFLAGPLATILGRFGQLHADVVVVVRTEGDADGDIRFVGAADHDPGIVWREPMLWAVPDSRWRNSPPGDPVPLAVDGGRTGGLNRLAIGALEAAGIAWRPVVQTGSVGAQLAAVSSGIAVAAIPRSAASAGLAVPGPAHGLPPLPSRAIAMHTRPGASPAARHLSVFVADALGRAGG